MFKRTDNRSPRNGTNGEMFGQNFLRSVTGLDCCLELETKVERRFAKVSIVSYSRQSLMIIALASQFHVYLPWGQRPFSIVS